MAARTRPPHRRHRTAHLRADERCSSAPAPRAVLILQKGTGRLLEPLVRRLHRQTAEIHCTHPIALISQARAHTTKAARETAIRDEARWPIAKINMVNQTTPATNQRNKNRSWSVCGSGPWPRTLLSSV